MVVSTKTGVVAARESEQGGADGDCFEQLRAQVQERLQQFRRQPVTPLAAYELEKALKALVEATARDVLQEEFNRLEPADKAETAAKVRYRGASYRINKRTKATIASSFGPLTVWSFLYLNNEDGEPGLHPLQVSLGIEAGATAVLAERVARWAVDHSQRQVRELLRTEHGLTWSSDRLRRALRDFRRTVMPFREGAQVQQVLRWLQVAQRSRGRHRPVLAAGRDGVMVPIRGLRYQEASTATLSVYDRARRRLGTVYLGQMPEKHQQTLSQALTALVLAVLQGWSGPLPRLAYVTDKGQAPDDYYRRVLRRMRHPRRPQERLEWEWVLDFFHVCGYVGQLRETLFGEGGRGWFGRMRHWLRDRRQGVSQVLRSAMQHYRTAKMSQAQRKDFWKAYRYLRNHRRWMDYARYRRQGLPIGSGVTEAACKTVFSERFKRSGMRWHGASGQVIVDLRVLHLSGIWSEVVRLDLQSRCLPERVSCRPQRRKSGTKAA
jgi:hypothetical protein